MTEPAIPAREPGNAERLRGAMEKLRRMGIDPSELSHELLGVAAELTPRGVREALTVLEMRERRERREREIEAHREWLRGIPR